MKHTKGRQKIEMRKVEAYKDRVITFSKRKSGIIKKMNEIVSLCNVVTAFLVFSEAGKPHTFAYPSLEEVFGCLKNSFKHEPSASTNAGPLVEAYKRQKIHDLMKRYVDLVEELEKENEKVKILEEAIREYKETKWWNDPIEGLSVKELKWRRQTLVELHASLSDSALKRFGNESGSSASQESCGRDGET